MMDERSADPVLQGRKGVKSSGLIKVTVEPGRHRLKLRVWSSTHHRLPTHRPRSPRGNARGCASMVMLGPS